MTSGVGTPFYLAPEMIKSSKHYTGAVDVYSFAIMAAQVIVGKLIYDAFDFDTQFCLYLLFSEFFVLFLHACSWASTAFVSAVCKGLRPSLHGCPEKMKTLIIQCWNSEASERPCKFIFLFVSWFLLFVFTVSLFLSNSVRGHCPEDGRIPVIFSFSSVFFFHLLHSSYSLIEKKCWSDY